MNEEKMNKKNFLCNGKGKFSFLTLSIIMLLSLAVGGTLAYIVVSSNDVKNQFTPAQVSCEVVVSGTDITVKNTSDVDAYLRTAIVVNWVVAAGENAGNIRGLAPVEAVDYSLVINSTDSIGDSEKWYKSGDYYYYKDTVASNTLAATSLVDDIAVLGEKPDGYDLSVEVVAEAIQADGTDADGVSPLQLHWGEEAAKWVGIYKDPNN